MSKRLRIGLVGTGFSAHFHLASYRKVFGRNFEVVALCGPQVDQRDALAREHGIAGQFGDYDEMLGSGAIDAVDICVPNELHVPFTLKAARAGKHIICEKPLGGFFGPEGAPRDWSADGHSRADMLAAVVEQIKTVKRAVTEAGVIFCYAENWVYAPPVVKLARLMEASGSTILRIQGEESHSGSHAAYARDWRAAGGGSLLRLCVHPIGAALHLKLEEGRRRDGRPIRVKTVSAHVTRLTDIDSFRREEPKHIVTGWNDVEDFAAITITFDDGSVAQMTSTDTKLGGINNYITAHGSRALVTANINPNTACQAYTPDAAYFKSEYIVEKTETKAGWSFPAPDEDMITGYPEELRDFVGAMQDGRAPRSDIMLAGDVLTVVYAGYLSSAEGRVVDITPFL